jgi:hypothetical protein
MGLRTVLLVSGAIFATTTIYKIRTLKIGPCSPELEDRLNRR